MSKPAVYLNALGMICALGSEHKQISERLFQGWDNALSFTSRFSPAANIPLGEVRESLPSVDDLPANEQSRSNQLLLAALSRMQADVDRALVGVSPERIGVVLGASTSGIREGETAMAQWLKDGCWPEGYSYRQQEMAAPAQCLARWLNARGPALTISTACSSSAKALACARRWLRSGICDVVIAGGVDSLCQLTVQGFGALESVSGKICNPFSNNRDGINIGEGAALFVMSKTPGPVSLRGVGESSDAHHISAPAPDGAGAFQAMSKALADAQLSASDVDYLNLHGTATRQNDKMESLAAFELLGRVPCSSTKPFTGHTLGAAGAIEAAFCWLTLTQDEASQNGKAYLPLNQWDGVKDAELEDLDLITSPRAVDPPKVAMSNSFAFGGNNISIVLESA